MRKIFATILFLFTFSFVKSQSYDIIRFAEAQGLPLAQIYSIYQHSNGAMAIGTLGGGFSLYNGNTFHNFSQNEGLVTTTINDIKEDSKGNLWLATNDGLSKFDGETFENHYDTSRKISTWKLAITKNDIIYLATSDGLIRYDGNSFINITEKLLSKVPKLYYMVMDDSGTIIFGSKFNVWQLKNNKIEEVKRFRQKHIDGIYKLNNDKIIIVANDSLYSYKSDQFWGKAFIEKNHIHNITALCEDKLDNLWVGTKSSGAFKINKSSVVNYNKSNGFTNFRVRTIIEDASSKIWFAADDGLYYLNHSKLEFFPNNPSVVSLWSVYVSRQNKTYVGSVEKGLFELKNNSFSKVFGERKYNPIYYYTLKDNRGDWWVASNQGLIYKPKNKLFDRSKLKIFKDKSIFSIYKDYKNQIWVGTDYYGLYRYDGNNFIKEHIDTAVTTIESFVEDKKNNLWIGTDIGVYRYDGEKYTSPQELKTLKRSAIPHMVSDRYRNIIWMAAFGKGIVKYNLPTKNHGGSVQIFSTSDGLNDNSILSIVEDFEGNIWAGTNKGLNKLIVNDKDSLVTVIPFYKSDGLLGSECVQQSAAIDSTGKLLIMTANGLLTFYPDKLNNLRKNITPKIISLKAIGFDSTTTFSKDFLFMDYGKDLEYKLPGVINNVQINYCGVIFPTSSELKFSYRLNNLKWSKPTTETMVNYYNLDPGNYTFCVKPYNSASISAENIAKLNFTVSAPFYKTMIFKASIVILFILLGVFFTLMRTKSIRKKNYELRINIEERKKINSVLRRAMQMAEKSEKLKSEFLAQMSHEIRSPIHTILSFTQLLEFELHDKMTDEFKESFLAIKKAGQRVVRTIDLVLNMSQIQTNTLETHFRVINLTSEILEPMYWEYSQAAKAKGLKLDFLPETKDVDIEGDENSLNQIVANLLDNAIKYTNKGKIGLKIFKTKKEKLAIEVSDTGIGISEEYLPKLFDSFTQEEQGYTRHYDGNGLGLALVDKYCKINNARISVSSQKGIGSTFTVVFS